MTPSVGAGSEPARPRRWAGTSAPAVLALALMTTLISPPAASAHEFFTGFTSFGDGTNVTTVVRYATISARVPGGATVGVAYYLTIGRQVGDQDECHEGSGTRLHPDPVYPNPDGSINAMSAVIDVEPGEWRVSFCGPNQIARGRVKVLPPAVVSGATFFSDGSSSKSGPSGARVSLFATSAAAGFEYRLVSAQDGGVAQPCGAYIRPINTTARFADSQGFIAQTAGNIDRPVGVWEICFLAEGQAVTGSATFTVV